MSRKILCIAIFMAIMFLLGCSSAGNSPIGPGAGDDGLIDLKLPEDFQGHLLWGAWKIYIDPDSQAVEVVQNREALPHFDVTAYVTPPDCLDCLTVEMKNFNTTTRIAEMLITLKNPTIRTGYDVRGILILNDAGHDIKNPDGWTPVFDDGMSPYFNPFKRYAKKNDFGAFPGGESYEETYLIYLPKPPNYAAIDYVVEAVWPKLGLREPYNITGEQVDGSLYTEGTDTVNFTCWVYDRNDDVLGVTVECQDLFSGTKDMTQGVDPKMWTVQISNEKLVGIGHYNLIIEAHDPKVGATLRDKYAINVIEKVFFWMQNTMIQAIGNCTFDIAAINGGPYDRGAYLIDGFSECTTFFAYDESFSMPVPALNLMGINPNNPTLQPYPPDRFDSAEGGSLAFSNVSEDMFQDGLVQVPLSRVVVSVDEMLMFYDDMAGDDSAHYTPGNSTLGVADVCDGFEQRFYMLWAETEGKALPVLRCYKNNYTTKKQIMGTTIPEELTGMDDGQFINDVDAILGIDAWEIDDDNVELYILEDIGGGATQVEVFNVYTDSITGLSDVTSLRTFDLPAALGEACDIELLAPNPEYVPYPDMVTMVVAFRTNDGGFFNGYINIYDPVSGAIVEPLGAPDMPVLFEKVRYLDTNNGSFTILVTSEVVDPEMFNMVIFMFTYM